MVESGHYVQACDDLSEASTVGAGCPNVFVQLGEEAIDMVVRHFLQESDMGLDFIDVLGDFFKAIVDSTAIEEDVKCHNTQVVVPRK